MLIGWSLLDCPQDVLARFKESHKNMADLPNKAMFQMNDTHPTIAVAELMRLLIDQEGLDWDKAWGITVKVGTPMPASAPGCDTAPFLTLLAAAWRNRRALLVPFCISWCSLQLLSCIPRCLVRSRWPSPTTQ